MPSSRPSSSATDDRGRRPVVASGLRRRARASHDRPSSSQPRARGSRRPMPLGFQPRWRHLANPAATFMTAGDPLRLRRPGIAAYGYLKAGPWWHRGRVGPAAGRRRSRKVCLVKEPRRSGVSHGHTYTTEADTVSRTLCRSATPTVTAGRLERRFGVGRRASVHGGRRICTGPVRVGPALGRRASLDELTLFGDPGVRADVRACARSDTIGYEIVTA